MILGLMALICISMASANICSKVDYTKDDRYDFDDVLDFIIHWGAEKGDDLYHVHYDLNKDGVVDMGDYRNYFVPCMKSFNT